MFTNPQFICGLKKMHLFTASTLGGALNTASLASSVKLSLRRHHTFGNQHIFGRSIGPGRQHLIAQASSSPSEEDDKLKFALVSSFVELCWRYCAENWLFFYPHSHSTARCSFVKLWVALFPENSPFVLSITHYSLSFSRAHLLC